MPAPNNEPVAVRPDRQELERRQRNRLDARVARALACECKLRRDPQIAGLVPDPVVNHAKHHPVLRGAQLALFLTHFWGSLTSTPD